MSTPKAQATAHKILCAAATLFAEKGFGRVSIKEIAEASGVNSALISYHFGSKTKLYTAIIDCQAKLFTALSRKVEALPLTPLEKIYRFTLGCLDLALDPTKQLRLLFQEMLAPSQLDQDIESRLAEIQATFHARAQAAIDAHCFAVTIDARQISLFLTGLLMVSFIRQKVLLAELGEEHFKSFFKTTLDTYLQPLLSKEE